MSFRAYTLLALAGCLSHSASAAERYLYIGDSHSVGAFGKELDSLLRSYGDFVSSYASCGSSPSWWFNGTPTSCGYAERPSEGKSFLRKSYPTPLLDDLLVRTKPSVTVVAHRTLSLRAAKCELGSTLLR